MYALIMAGGSGTRLWPISRKNSPKQVRPFLDDKTLLQKTYERLLPDFSVDRIKIACNISQKDEIVRQIPQVKNQHILTEPERRDTAAAIALATLRIYLEDPEALIININSDAHIVDEKEYLRVIAQVQSFLSQNPEYITGIGISPTYPETGYGYIKKGRILQQHNKDTIYRVAQFTEKPDLIRAQQYVSSGEYLWNPTLFAWKAKTMLELFKEHAPEISTFLEDIKKKLISNPSNNIDDIFAQIPRISIDYAIFEKAEYMAVIPAQFGWSDVGSWRTLYDLQKKDDSQNVHKEKVISHRSYGNLVYGQKKKVITLAGVENLIVVDTPDALLICDKESTQDVKKITEILKSKNLDEYL